MVNALWRAAAGQRPYNRIAILRHGGLKMPCNIDEMLQRQFYFFGTYFLEKEILHRWEKAAESAHVIFDVGANAGIFSLAALASNKNATVHAFEPTPEIARRLRATAAMNDLPKLIVNEMAVADHTGQMVLRRWRGEDGSNEGMNFITTDGLDDGGEAVLVTSLDRYCADHTIDRIDLLKIDVQGNESAVFSGAKRMLQEGKIGTIFAELNWQAGTHDGPAAVMVQQLEKAGYLFSLPNDSPLWRKSGSWMWGLSDIIAQHA